MPLTNLSRSSSGTPSRSAITSSVNGLAKPLMNSPCPGARKSSNAWSASAHMASSFSLRRLGVISRINRERWLVWWRIERGQLVAERQLVAVLLDQLGDVTVSPAFEAHRKTGERSGHRGARRPRFGVIEDGAGFFPAGHHRDVVVLFLGHRTLLPERLVIGIGVRDELAAAEEVQLGGVVHHLAPFQSQSVRMCLSEMSIRFP